MDGGWLIVDGGWLMVDSGWLMVDSFGLRVSGCWFQVAPPSLKLPPSLLIRATEDRSADKWFEIYNGKILKIEH